MWEGVARASGTDIAPAAAVARVTPCCEKGMGWPPDGKCEVYGGRAFVRFLGLGRAWLADGEEAGFAHSLASV